MLCISRGIGLAVAELDKKQSAVDPDIFLCHHVRRNGRGMAGDKETDLFPLLCRISEPLQDGSRDFGGFLRVSVEMSHLAVLLARKRFPDVVQKKDQTVLHVRIAVCDRVDRVFPNVVAMPRALLVEALFRPQLGDQRKKGFLLLTQSAFHIRLG